MYFLVDFENVRSNGLRGVDYLNKDDYLTLFFSSVAHCCENRYLEAIERSGCAFDTCKLVKAGKNGLDFYIATRVGEFYGNGHYDRVAIISKDQGYRAVRDYWDVRLPSNMKMILSASIEKGLIASNDNSVRVNQLRNKMKNVEIGAFQARYDERKRLQKILEGIFRETTFADKMDEIQEMVEMGENKKIIYLSALHRFGKRQGLEIYDYLKPFLSQQVQ